MSQKTTKQPINTEARWLPRLSLFVFDHYRVAALLWLCLTIFGAFSYATFMRREGFPSVDIPFSVVSGAYIVNDPKKVDSDVTKPLSEIILQDDRVSSVQASARGTFYNVFVRYDEGTNAPEAGKELQKRIDKANFLPSEATLDITTPKFGFTARGDDGVISLYSDGEVKSTQELATEGEKLAAHIKSLNLSTVGDISIVDPFVQGVDPATGMAAVSQTSFDRYGVRESDKNRFFDSVAVGATQKKGTDGIEFDDQLRAAVEDYNKEQSGKTSFVAAVSASYAPQIKDQISELQRALLEGLLAVLIIGSIVIAIRASLITVLSMVTVLAITVGLLFTIGYSLNTITLFALILCLALIVDDTIIMIEAIDAQRRRRKDPRETVHVATGKISRAMVAATSTAILSFVPLLFVGGILGSFIRAIPVTVISSLLVSLLVALIFIPVFARYLLLGKKQMGSRNVHEPAAGIEAKIARFISIPMLWARHSTKKLLGVGIVAILVGFMFIATAGYFFQKVTFNIFPPAKDTNDLLVGMEFKPGSTIEEALAVATQSDKIVADTLGSNFKQASYYASGSAQGASLFIGIIPYHERDVRSPELVDQLKKAYSGFDGATVSVNQIDAGPPLSPFTVRIAATDREAALKLAKDVQAFLLGKELTRLSGEKAKIVNASVSDPGTYERAEGEPYVQVAASFDGTDISTLVTLAQTAVEDEFTSEKVQSYGLDKDALQFDFGQEDENQDSFKTLALAFPIVLLGIYLLLAFQFRSLVQPLLIFMAIPFSLFGITLGLYITDNPFSFFAMLGFFALIGLSLKNTILLTDYANQQRRIGVPAVDAAVEALGERFRPLIATSLTAVVSLIPLAIMSPFWEGLAVVLICGLLSSTLLVILVFPYYYLGVEFMRMRISRKAGLLWLGLTILVTMLLSKSGLGSFAMLPLVALVVAVLQVTFLKLRRRQKSI